MQSLDLKPSVVIGVDLFGLPADVDEISEIAHAEGMKVLIDGHKVSEPHPRDAP